MYYFVVLENLTYYNDYKSLGFSKKNKKSQLQPQTTKKMKASSLLLLSAGAHGLSFKPIFSSDVDEIITFDDFMKTFSKTYTTKEEEVEKYAGE